jgi:hypothetical protein
MAAGIPVAGGVIGAVEPDRRTTVADFKEATTVIGSNGYVYIYVKANGVIAASQTDVAVTTAGLATDGSGAYVNTAAFALNEFGWVRTAALVV